MNLEIRNPRAVLWSRSKTRRAGPTPRCTKVPNPSVISVGSCSSPFPASP